MTSRAEPSSPTTSGSTASKTTTSENTTFGTEGDVGRFAQARGDSAVLRGARWVRHLVTSDPFPEQYTEALAGCQRPVTSGRRIGVLGPVGGAGVSTLTALLALQLAAARTDAVTAVEVAGLGAGLSRRLPGREDEPATEQRCAGLTGAAGLLARDAELTRERLDAHGVVVAERLHRFRWGGELEPAGTAVQSPTVRDVEQILAQSSTASVLDMGSGPARAAVPLLPGLHALLVAIPASRAAGRAGAELVAELTGRHPDLPISPVLIDVHRSRGPGDRAAVDELGAGLVHRLDHDAHLVDGLGLRVGLLGRQRRLQLARIASWAMGAATGESA